MNARCRNVTNPAPAGTNPPLPPGSRLPGCSKTIGRMRRDRPAIGMLADPTMDSQEPQSADERTRSSEQPDYYFENDLLVYTAHFHVKRGSCCGSGCRHCPYDPRHIAGNRHVRP